MSEFLSDTQKQTIREILNRADVRQPLTTSLADIIALGRLFYGFLELEAMANDMSQDDVGIAYRAGYKRGFTNAREQVSMWVGMNRDSIMNNVETFGDPIIEVGEVIKRVIAVIDEMGDDLEA